MKISKGFIAQLVVAILISLTFMGLGNWQLNRAHDVKIAKQFVPDSTRIPLEKIAAAGSNIAPDAINRLVSVSGRYREIFIAPKQPLTLGDKKSMVNLEVRLLELPDNRGILIVRGIESLENQEIIGQVKINGRLYPRQTSDATRAINGELSRIDPALIVSRSNLELFDGFIIATSEATKFGQEILTSRVPAPQLKSKVAGNYWQHISYVFVWWLMALLVLLAPFYNSIKERESGGKVRT
jgi:surfeit locus 1 family protein